MILSKEQQVLLNLIALSVSDNPSSLVLPREEFDGVSFVAVAKESIYQAVNVQAYSSASTYYKDIISEPVLNKWQEFAVNSIKSNAKVISAQNDLVKILEGGGYKYAIIKGASASSYYKKPFERILGDVDFLIRHEDRENIENLLIENGYQKDPMVHISHVVFTKPDAHLEMHFEVAGLPENEHKRYVQNFVLPTVETAKESDLDGNLFQAPIALYHGIIILLHTQHHLLFEGVGLRHLCDLAVFVSKTHNEDFWTQSLLPFAKKIGLYKFLSVMVATCVKYLKIPRPIWLEEFDSPSLEDIILDVFSSGNLGKKDEVRAKSGMLIAKKGNKKRGAISTLAVSLHKAVLLKYPFVKKWWILYPFIYIYKAIQNVMRIIFGKRTSIKKMIPEAQKRQSLYDKLDVYKTKENKNDKT